MDSGRYKHTVKNTQIMEQVSEAAKAIVAPKADYYSHRTDRRHIKHIMFEIHGISGILDQHNIKYAQDRSPGEGPTPGRQMTPDHRKVKKYRLDTYDDITDTFGRQMTPDHRKVKKKQSYTNRFPGDHPTPGRQMTPDHRKRTKHKVDDRTYVEIDTYIVARTGTFAESRLRGECDRRAERARGRQVRSAFSRGSSLEQPAATRSSIGGNQQDKNILGGATNHQADTYHQER